jgi:hypothetical protein
MGFLEAELAFVWAEVVFGFPKVDAFFAKVCFA